MRIAICDDEKKVCTNLEKLLLEIDPLTLTKDSIDVYYSGEKLVKCLTQNNCYDVIFLDIEIGAITGIDVGKHIREEIKSDVQIVFISRRESYAMDLFDIRPLNFLIKPLDKDKVIKVYFSAKKLVNNSNQFYVFTKGNNTVKKKIDEIIYFESDNRKVNIITNKGKESFYGQLERISEELKKEQFLRIHKSYVVNYNHIISIGYDKVVMSNGKELTISQKRRKFIREQHIMYENMEDTNDFE